MCKAESESDATTAPQPRFPDFEVKQRFCPGGAGTAVDRSDTHYRQLCHHARITSTSTAHAVPPNLHGPVTRTLASPRVLNSSARPLIRPNHFTHTQAALKPVQAMTVHVLVVAAASNHTKHSFYCR